jgi:5-methylcytosine-specific restriction endonuclease McrA
MQRLREVNGEELRRRDKARYERDKEKRIELATEATHRRRARKRKTEVEHGIGPAALRKKYGDVCPYCGVTLDFRPGTGRVYNPKRASVEHVVPLSQGGTHTWENLILCCLRCNLRKNRRTDDEWRAVLERERGSNRDQADSD